MLPQNPLEINCHGHYMATAALSNSLAFPYLQYGVSKSFTMFDPVSVSKFNLDFDTRQIFETANCCTRKSFTDAKLSEVTILLSYFKLNN